MPNIKRQTAYKCTIGNILKNPFIRKEGWEPSYITINGINISRVNILAAVVSKDSNALNIDDGTGTIQIMLFSDKDKQNSFKVGDVLLIIGRPREYNGRKFIAPEIMKIIDEKKWITYRKKELEILGPISTDLKKPESYEEDESISDRKKKKATEEEAVEPTENYSGTIMKLIRKLDDGNGADTEKVVKDSKVKGAEKIIMNLLYEGEIFEIRPGKIKILE
jgi:hypothetical protein